MLNLNDYYTADEVVLIISNTLDVQIGAKTFKNKRVKYEKMYKLKSEKIGKQFFYKKSQFKGA